MVKKPYNVSYSKKHLEWRNINDFQFVYVFAESFLVVVLISSFLISFYIVFLSEEI